MNIDTPSVPIITLAGISNLTDLLGEMPLPTSLPPMSNKSLLFHPRIAEEAQISLTLCNETLIPQLVQSLVQTSADHLELKDNYIENEPLLDEQQNMPELLQAILHWNPNVFKGPSANSPYTPQAWDSSRSSSQECIPYNQQQSHLNVLEHQCIETPLMPSCDDTPSSSLTPYIPQQIHQGLPQYHYSHSPFAPLQSITYNQGDTNTLIIPPSVYDTIVVAEEPPSTVKEESSIVETKPEMNPCTSNSQLPVTIGLSGRDASMFTRSSSLTSDPDISDKTPLPPSLSCTATSHTPVETGSSQRQTCIVLVSQDKEFPRATDFNKCRELPPDSKIKEPVTLKKQSKEDLKQKRNLQSDKETLLTNDRAVKKHHSYKIESGSESEDEHKSKNKYFKAREKERELQRRKEKDQRKSSDEHDVEQSLTERIKQRKRNYKCVEENNSTLNNEGSKVLNTKFRKLERQLVPVQEKLTIEELMETNTYQRFNKLIKKIFDETEDQDLDIKETGSEDDSAPEHLMIPKYQLQDLCTEVAKLKSLEAMEHIPSEKLIRLLTILEKNICDGAKVSPVGDPNDDEYERKLFVELAMERVMHAVNASLATLYILTSTNMHKRVYLEDVIDRVILFTKFQLHNTIYPIFDPVYRVDSKDEYVYTSNVRKKRAGAKEVREKSVLMLYNKLIEVVSLLSELLNIQILTDTAVLHASTMGVSPFFVESTSELQLAALRLVSTIFSKYENHRKLLLNDILASIARLPSSKRSLRSYRVNSDEYIQMLTALVLQLIQCMIVLPPNLGTERATNSSDADVVIVTSFNATRSTVSNFLCMFLAKCSSKSEEIDYRPIFENFVQDLLTTVNKPEFPAAELMLSVLGTLLVVNFVNKELEMSLRVTSLDCLGVVAARLRKDTVVAKYNVGDIDEMIQEIKAEEQKDVVVKGDIKSVLCDEERTQFLQRLLLEYLAVQEQVEPALTHARHFYLAQWYQDIVKSTDPSSSNLASITESNSKSNLKSKKHKKRRKEKSSDVLSEENKDSRNNNENSSNTVLTDVYKTKEEKKKFLISKIYPFQNTVSKKGIKSQTIRTYIDQDSAALIARYLASKRPFSQSFNTYLKHILKVLTEPSVLIRTKAMKCLMMIVEVDPDVLGLNDMQLGVRHSFLDHSTSVREAAVDLVGKFVLSRPELISKYYDMLLARILDTGVSVRKRVIKILKDICIECPDFPKIPEICVKMINRVNDEDGIRKLVIEVFQNMWFTPVKKSNFNSELVQKVMNIADVVAVSRNADWLEQLLNSLFKPKENKEDSRLIQSEPPKALLTASKQIIDCLIENIIRLDGKDGGLSQRLVACMVILFQFSKIRPQLLVDHAIILQPYMSLKCQTQGDFQIISYVARIVELVVPLIEHPSQTFLAQLEEDSAKLIMMQDRPLIPSCVSCLSSVVNITQNFKLVTDCFKKYYIFIFNYKTYLGKNNQSPNTVKNNVLKDNGIDSTVHAVFRRSVYIVGLLIRYFNFQDQKVHDLLPENIIHDVFDTLMFFLTQDEDSQYCTLKAIGNVCIRHYDLMLGPVLKTFYQQILKDKNAQLNIKTQVLQNIDLYLQEEERRMIKQDQEWDKMSKQENLKEMGDVSSGMASTIIQLYLKEILDSFIHPHANVRQAALQVIQLILNQGLVHPVQIVPYLICMGTDIEKIVSNIADKQLQDIEKKYPGFIHMKAQAGIKLSYKLQKTLKASTSVVRGFRIRENELPVALNGFLYSILRTKQQRRALVLSILRQFDEQAKTSLSQMLYLTDNMAYFPYQVQDEPLFIIHHIDIMISVNGTNLLQSIRELFIQTGPSQDQRIDPETGNALATAEEEDFENESILLSKIPEDTHYLQEYLTASQGCILLLALKQHLKTLYSFNDSKIMQYSPSDTGKTYEKVLTRKSNDRFNPKATLLKIRQDSSQFILDEEARKALVLEYLEFKHLIMDLDADDDDDYDDMPAKLEKSNETHNRELVKTSLAIQSSENSNHHEKKPSGSAEVQSIPAVAIPDSGLEPSTPQIVPKLIIKLPKQKDKHHHHHHRSHKHKRPRH